MSINSECTQADLARELGLSQATVSLALTGHPRVSESTRRRVLTLARCRRYRPDPGLTRAVLKRWKGQRAIGRETLAVVLPEAAAPRREEAEVARRMAERRGYRMDILPASRPAEVRRLNEVLFARGIRGVLVQDARESHVEEELDLDRIVMVHVGLRKQHAMPSAVHLNHFRAIQVAFHEAERCGFRRIGFVLPGMEEGTLRLQQAALGLEVQLAHEVEAGRRSASAAELVGVVHRTRSHRPEDLRDEVAGLLEAEPDALIGIALWCQQPLELLGLSPRRVPAFAAIVPPYGRKGVAGFEPPASGIMERAVDLLHHRLLDHDFGVPRLPHTITFLPPWRDHPSFVPRSRCRRSARTA